jgi:hypothetical protein
MVLRMKTVLGRTLSLLKEHFFLRVYLSSKELLQRRTCIRVMYTGLFIRIHVAVSKHGGMVMDPSYVMKLEVSG